MTHPVVTVALALYFGLNFLCALALHLHAERQAHLRHRVMDLLVHFVLLTAFGLPALLFVVTEALFGAEKRQKTSLEPAEAIGRAA